MKQKRSIISLILVICILLSCSMTGAAAALPTQPTESQLPYYFHYPFKILMAGMPKTIRAQFDYDSNFIKIASDYPDLENSLSYNGTGFAFPLAAGEYGKLYDVSYSVNDTIISFTYTLKSGVTVDDYFNALDAVQSAEGNSPVSREKGARYDLPIFDIVMAAASKETANASYFAKVVDLSVLEVLTADGKSLDVSTNSSDSEVYCHYRMVSLPDPNAHVEDPTEEENLYLDRLLDQYYLDVYEMTEYDEFYKHEDENGEIDWALVRASAPKATSPGWVSPAYYEFGNRVMDIGDQLEPFAFGVGVYSVKHGCFFDVSEPEVRELPDIERIWTDIGAGRLIGDMDGNDHLDVTDATLIQRCQAGFMSYPTEDQIFPSDWVEGALLWYSDFDMDGERDITDATAIQRYLGGLKCRPDDRRYPHEFSEIKPTEPAPTEPATVPAEPQPTEPEPDPSIPRIIGFSSTGRGVEIKLSTVEGAEKYRVYYKNKNGNWVKMGETTTDTFIDSDVSVGTTYRYTVRCIKADLSAFTSDYDRDGWSYTYAPRLDTPQISKVEAVAKGVEITWKPVDGAVLYRVYRKSSKGWTKLGDTDATSYIDTSVSPKDSYSEYTYTVRCLSQGGKDFASDYDTKGTHFYLVVNPVVDSFTSRLDGISLHIDAYCFTARLYRKTAGGSWTRIAEYDTQEVDTYRDTDVEPGKTYYYTARCVDENGNFLSYYNTTGWKYTYQRSECIPELEFFMYNGEDMVLVQPKEDNKFGIKNFNLHVYNDDMYNKYLGTFALTDEPTYIRADFFTVERNYRMILVGVDEKGNEITKTNFFSARTVVAPTDLKAVRTGDRQYRFTWHIYYGYPDWYNFDLVSTDGKYVIYSGDLGDRQYDLDLSDYPEDTEWIAFVSVTLSDGISVSWVDQIEFREADYQ